MDQPITRPDAIRNLQRYLRRLSFDDPAIPRVPVDGIFEEATEDAVKAFQSLYGLEPTGRADLETWDRIYDAYLRAERAADRTPVTNFFPLYPEGYELSLGESSLTVSLLQLLFQELSVIYDILTFAEVTGVFDDITEQNVRRFQRASLLPDTGRVDLRTWNHILQDYTNYAQ
jgi:peptidoglycan hydrolase-like protein with peptidoglycan-binding domain